MRTVLLLLVMVAIGCGNSHEVKKPTPPPFALDAPKSLEILNGQSIKQEVPVNWQEGEREDLDITATIDPEDRGVSARAEPGRLEGGAGLVQVVITVTATEIAAAGNYSMTITAKAVKSGKSAKATIAVKVPRKE